MSTPEIKESPPSLSSLQHWLKWVLTEPGGIEAALKAEPGLRRPQPSPRLDSWIAADKDRPAPRRLAVYAEAFFKRLLDSLGADFAVCRRTVGPGEFRRLVAGYLIAHPPCSPDIGDAGRHFPAFIGRRAEGSSFPFLADLARLEWSALTALRSQRLPPLDLDALERIPPANWAGARLLLDPSARLLELLWPVHRLWRDGGLRTLPAPRRARMVVYRDDDWVKIKAAASEEFSLLKRLAAGAPLGRACAALEREAGRAVEAVRVKKWFRDWTIRGIVKGVVP